MIQDRILTEDEIFDIEHALELVYGDFQDACAEGSLVDLMDILRALVTVAGDKLLLLNTPASS